MKRIISAISLILSVTLLLCACSSAPASSTSSATTDSSKPKLPVAATPEEISYTDITVEYNDIQKGYISHPNAVEYTLIKEDGYECTDNFYLYLPKGTKLSSEKEFTFFTYEKDMSLNTVMMANSDLEVKGFVPSFAAGEFTLSGDCILRLCVKGSLADVKISVPSDKEGAVMTGTASEMAVMDEILDLNEYLYSRGNSVNYIFISDLHVGSFVNDPDGDGLRNYDELEATDERMENRKGLVAKAVSTANLSPQIDFVVIGGDIINGYETPESKTYQQAKKSNPSLTVRQHCIDQLKEVLSPLKECKKPVFILAGNHDDNAGHSLWQTTNHPKDESTIHSYLLSDLDWDKHILSEFVNVKMVRDDTYSYGGKSISKYYYYDLEKNDKTVRIIALDYTDRRYAFNSDGSVNKQAPTSNSNNQLKWFAEKALVGDFDECIILSHATLNETNARMADVIKTYNSRSAFSSMGNFIKVDYSARTSGNILIYHHGHDHENMDIFNSSCRFWDIGSDAAAFDITSASADSCYRYYSKNKQTELRRTGGRS